MPLGRRIAIYTFSWLIIYIPGETYVTVTIAGLRGLLYGAYIMNVIGMGLMFWGAMSAWRERVVAPGLLTAAWSWNAATMWRASADRFWYVSLGRELPGGTVELWLGPVITALAVLPMVGSLVLVFRQAYPK